MKYILTEAGITGDLDKLPPQAAAIIGVLRRLSAGHHGRACAHEAIFAGLTEKLKTTQPVARVFAYYRPVLLKGWMNEVEVEMKKIKEPRATKTKDHSEPRAKIVKPAHSGGDDGAKMLRVKLDGETEITGFPIMRQFSLGGALLVLCATEASDNALWVVLGGKHRAILIGSLTDKAYRSACRASSLALTLDQFDWHNSKVTLPESVRDLLGFTTVPKPAARCDDLPDEVLLGVYEN